MKQKRVSKMKHKKETMVSVKLGDDRIERIAKIADKLGGINRSIFLRQAVDEKLEREELR